MSGAVATAPARLFPGAPHEHDLSRGPLTLEERLERDLGAALDGRAAACPACGGSLERAGDAASCGGCGSTLS